MVKDHSGSQRGNLMPPLHGELGYAVDLPPRQIGN